ncbi:aspartic proteinase CDR1-like [Arachis stenosperma]|uniref:aspartic proteinase CDR1-like n=1 Tax=Arachis stenosperma TaxID=217475 RepID=UPI0025AD3737|nr:aspartic proteinase CDR1-like [Arachis stenosperma]
MGGSSRVQNAVVVVTAVLVVLGMNVDGFSTELIPRHSPASPFYNPSRSHYEHLQDAIQRSRKRVKHFENKLEAPLSPAGIEYLMRISIGTPPVEFVAVADTGSDLTWTQCLPCTQCYKQNFPIYDPRRSSSYKTISCKADVCFDLQTISSGCDRNNSTCEYLYGYADSSKTQGTLSTESITIGGTVIRNNIFGCSHLSTGTFPSTASGIIGLGAGKLSLVSQLGESGRKFSYCLAPYSSKSTTRISFGSDALLSGVSTPIQSDPAFDAFYFLSLESLSVGSNTIPLPSSNGGGNIVIDSGTTVTFLPQETLLRLVSALEEAIRVPKTTDPTSTFSLCYRVEGESEFPNVTADFKGARVVLRPVNTFVEVADGVVCLAVLPTQRVSVFGNIAQTNFLVGYDLDARAVTFKPTDCTKAN